MKINELIKTFEIYRSNEEQELLEKLSTPRKYLSLTERERFTAEALIRKSLIIKVGTNNPTLIANEV